MDQYFITKYKLIEHKAKGIYTYDDFLKYEKWIKEIFPGVYEVAREVALLPEEQIKGKYISPLVNKVEQMRKDGYGIYIYGAGRHGVECADFFEICNIKIDGFVVTNMDGNPDRIRKYPVNDLKSVLEKNEKVFAILAVMELMQKEIIKDLKVELEQGCDIMWMAF